MKYIFLIFSFLMSGSVFSNENLPVYSSSELLKIYKDGKKPLLGSGIVSSKYLSHGECQKLMDVKTKEISKNIYPTRFRILGLSNWVNKIATFDIALYRTGANRFSNFGSYVEIFSPTNFIEFSCINGEFKESTFEYNKK